MTKKHDCKPGTCPGHISKIPSPGDVVASLVFSRGEAWETVLRLHVRAAPWWVPSWAWRRVIARVLTQSEEQK